MHEFRACTRSYDESARRTALLAALREFPAFRAHICRQSSSASQAVLAGSFSLFRAISARPCPALPGRLCSSGLWTVLRSLSMNCESLVGLRASPRNSSRATSARSRDRRRPPIPPMPSSPSSPLAHSVVSVHSIRWQQQPRQAGGNYRRTTQSISSLLIAISFAYAAASHAAKGCRAGGRTSGRAAGRRQQQNVCANLPHNHPLALSAALDGSEMAAISEVIVRRALVFFPAMSSSPPLPPPPHSPLSADHVDRARQSRNHHVGRHHTWISCRCFSGKRFRLKKTKVPASQPASLLACLPLRRCPMR